MREVEGGVFVNEPNIGRIAEALRGMSREDRRKKIQNTAKQVAVILAQNGITFSEVSRIFREVTHYLAVTAAQDSD